MAGAVGRAGGGTNNNDHAHVMDGEMAHTGRDASSHLHGAGMGFQDIEGEDTNKVSDQAGGRLNRNNFSNLMDDKVCKPAPAPSTQLNQKEEASRPFLLSMLRSPCHQN